MNVLTFVMCVLLLLTLMTYGRLEMFRGFAFVQVQFKEYMEKTERRYINDAAVKRYESSPATKKEKSEKEKQQKNPASSRLSFNLFVNKEQRAAHQVLYEPHLNAAKNLIRYLYGDQQFFLEAEETRPDFLNEIFNALMNTTDELLQTQKLKKKKEIATIDLGDQQLNDIFTKMLKGSIEEADTSLKPERGYRSLLDFITIDKNKLKIRVFLASPQLLMALYGNPNTVQDILNLRYNLYLDVKNERLTKDAATVEFQGVFQNQQYSDIPNTMLDFGVSKTNPKTYR